MAVALALGAALPAAAQVADTATPAATPAPAQTALPIPAAPVIVLPTPAAAPTPRPPRAAPSPTSTPTPAPRPSASDTPAPQPTTAVIPVPLPSAAPVAAVPVASPTPAAPSPSPSASAVAAAAGSGGSGYWLAAAAAAALALAALFWVLLRRRRADAAGDEAWVEEAAAAEPVAVTRARLALGFRPRRAGVNLLSATSENEIVVSNTGDAPAEDIRLQVRLLSAHGGQDGDLAAFYAEPIGRPAVAAFALAPGEERTVTAVAALPRDAIRSLTAAGRPMFVPIVAVNLTYATAGLQGQLAQAFAVGVERVDSPKLAPFWLDTPSRTYDQVAARTHAAALER